MFDAILSIALASGAQARVASRNPIDGLRCGASAYVTGDPLPSVGRSRKSYFIETIDSLFDRNAKLLGFVYADHDRVDELVELSREVPDEDRKLLGLGPRAPLESQLFVSFKGIAKLGFVRKTCVTALPT